jgi:hypothetical protein
MDFPRRSSDRNGLHQIVVGAQLQAFDTVLDLVAGGKEQHRHALSGGANSLQHAPAIQPREHHVQHDEIVVLGPGKVQPVQAVAYQIHHEPGFREALPQVFTRLLLVFDDQDLHRRLSLAWLAFCMNRLR